MFRSRYWHENVKCWLFVENLPIIFVLTQGLSIEKTGSQGMLPSTYLVTYRYHCLSVRLIFHWQCTVSLPATYFYHYLSLIPTGSLLATYCFFAGKVLLSCLSAIPTSFPFARYCFFAGNVLYHCLNVIPTGFPLAIYCYPC